MARRSPGEGSITQLADGRWRGTFEAGYTASGKRRRLAVTAPTKTKCRDRLRERMQEENGAFKTAVRDMRLKAWLDSWLEARESQVRPKTFEAESGPLRLYAIPTIGQIKLSELSPDDIRKVHAKMRRANLSSTYIAYVQRILQQSLKAAVMEGHQIPNGVLLMPRPKTSISDREPIPLDDAKELVEASWTLHGDGDTHDGSRWLAGLLQGLRLGEALGLTWDHVDFENNLITVEWQLQEVRKRDGIYPASDSNEARQLTGQYHLTRPKSKAGIRVIPMVGPMRESLLRWRDNAPESPWNLVWPAASGLPFDRRKDRRCWRALQDSMGVTHHSGRYFKVHEMRNTTATLLLAANVPAAIIVQILGHTSIKTSEIYMAVDDKEKRAAIESVATLLGLELEPPS